MTSKTVSYDNYLELKHHVRDQDKKIQKLNDKIDNFHNNNVEKRATNFTELSKQISGVNNRINNVDNRINNLIYWILGTGIAVIGIIITILK